MQADLLDASAGGHNNNELTILSPLSNVRGGLLTTVREQSFRLSASPIDFQVELSENRGDMVDHAGDGPIKGPGRPGHHRECLVVHKCGFNHLLGVAFGVLSSRVPERRLGGVLDFENDIFTTQRIPDHNKGLSVNAVEDNTTEFASLSASKVGSGDGFKGAVLEPALGVQSIDERSHLVIHRPPLEDGSTFTNEVDNPLSNIKRHADRRQVVKRLAGHILGPAHDDFTNHPIESFFKIEKESEDAQAGDLSIVNKGPDQVVGEIGSTTRNAPKLLGRHALVVLIIDFILQQGDKRLTHVVGDEKTTRIGAFRGSTFLFPKITHTTTFPANRELLSGNDFSLQLMKFHSHGGAASLEHFGRDLIRPNRLPSA